MDIDLSSIGEESTCHCFKATISIIKATLQFPASPEFKGKKIADDIVFTQKARGSAPCRDIEAHPDMYSAATRCPEGLCLGSHEALCVGSEVYWIWDIISSLTFILPRGHPWQKSLLLATYHLFKRDDLIPHEFIVRVLGKDLPHEIVPRPWSNQEFLSQIMVRQHEGKY